MLYNSIFIYNILLQLYPKSNNTFTFWKKYDILSGNKAHTTLILNSHNTFGEWNSNLLNTFDSELLSNILNLTDNYKRNYSILENKITQLFSELSINQPEQLFIILSTFINQYDSTTKYINFDDYNSDTNLNLLANKLNEQVNIYSYGMSLLIS